MSGVRLRYGLRIYQKTYGKMVSTLVLYLVSYAACMKFIEQIQEFPPTQHIFSWISYDKWQISFEDSLISFLFISENLRLSSVFEKRVSH